MTFMTHDTHDHNLGKTGNEKCIFSKRAFFVLIFVIYLECT